MKENHVRSLATLTALLALRRAGFRDDLVVGFICTARNAESSSAAEGRSHNLPQASNLCSAVLLEAAWPNGL